MTPAASLGPSGMVEMTRTVSPLGSNQMPTPPKEPRKLSFTSAISSAEMKVEWGSSRSSMAATASSATSSASTSST